MAILGILSSCRSARDLERFAKRHHQAFGSALDLELPKAPCDSAFLYLFERVDLEAFFGLLRELMIAWIAYQDKNFDQLIYDGKILRGSAEQPDDTDRATRFVTQVTLYARELGVAIPQTLFDTCESHESAALQTLLSTLELEGVMIQADALHTRQRFSTRRRAGRRPDPDGETEPAQAVSADRLPVPQPPALPCSDQRCRGQSRPPGALDSPCPQPHRFHSRALV
jgi:hypothetical protein